MAAKDGGYYAIKGFLYQFDKTIIEIIDNPMDDIYIENIQDINYSNFVLQVKHKETATYSPSKIKPAIVQLLDLFNSDQSIKIKLYCFFKNKNVSTWELIVPELDEILSSDACNYSDELKSNFSNNFVIQFSEDYEDQFKQTLRKIKSEFGYKDDATAFITHAIIRSNLLDVAVKKNVKERKINSVELREFIEENNQVLFEKSYSKYLGKATYEKEIKKRFFVFKKASIEKYERLFIIDFDNSDLAILNKIILTVSNKYYVFYEKGGLKSPPPYILIKNIDLDKYLKLKKKLWDSGSKFNDGTNFHGDSFRPDQIVIHPKSKNDFRVKFISEEKLDDVLKNLDFDEIFQFNINTEFIHLSGSSRNIEIIVDSLQQVLNIIS